MNLSRLTAAQIRALRLVQGGGYFFSVNTGNAYHQHHQPGVTPVIDRRTLYVLGSTGLKFITISGLGILSLTDDGMWAYTVTKNMTRSSGGSGKITQGS